MQIVPPDTDPVSVFERRVAGAKRRRARRGYIEAAGAVPATTPMWTGRAGWLADAQLWALGDGAAVLRGQLAPQTFLNLCRAAARYADSATGRHMAATATTLARDSGCSVRTVSTWRTLLAESGLGVLARQGSGGGGRPNRAPVWHLMSRPAVTPPRTCDLPPLRSSRGLPHLERNSPSALARSKSSPPTTARRRRQAPHRPPRPLQLQRLAGELVRRSHGLHRGHIGSVCDAIRGSGIDPTAVTAAQIASALDADMHESGWRWPDRIERPGAFLAYRLSRVSGRLKALTPASVGSGYAAANGLEPTAAPGAADPPRHRFLESGSDTDCSVCGSPEASRRPWLPTRRAHVCDACWSVAALPSSAPAAASALSVPGTNLSQQEIA